MLFTRRQSSSFEANLLLTLASAELINMATNRTVSQASFHILGSFALAQIAQKSDNESTKLNIYVKCQ